MSRKGGRRDHAAPLGLDLRFAGAIEQEFRTAHLVRTGRRTLLWQSLELFVAPVIVFLHRDMHGGDFHPDMLAGAAIAFACSVVLAALAFHRYDTRHYLAVAAWLIPLRSMVYAVMIADFVHDTGSGTAALTASAFGQYFFSGLLHHQALRASALTVLTYLVALILDDVPLGTLAYAVAVVLAVQTMATVVAFDAERAARMSFIEHGAVVSEAAHDGLTGLRNRRDFDERLDAYWNQAMARREALTILMLDVDHFKAYNDRDGHQAGDDVLQRIAGALRLAARGSDVVARYGGEEFVMLAQGLDEPGAAALGERVRSAVEQLAIAHERSSCAPVITASVGIAHVVPQAGRTAAGAVQLADQNLYVAKREGRNRFVLRGGDYATLKTGRFDVAT